MAITPINFAQTQSNVSSAPPTPKPGFLDKVGGFVKNAATSLVKPFAQAGVMVGNAGLTAADTFGLLSPQASANLKNIQQNGIQDPTFGQLDAPTVNLLQSPLTPQNTKAIKSSVGEGVNLGAMLGGAEVAPGQGIIKGAIQGAKAGAIVGGGQGMGQSLQANQGLGDTLKNTATGALAGGAVGGVIGGVTGAFSGKTNGDLNTDHPIFKSNYDQTLANATEANNQAGEVATNSIHEASSTVNDMMNGAGNQYDQAPNIISQADPNAGTEANIDMLTKMQQLKDTKAWALPSSVRDAIPTELNGPIKFTPQQSQDIIKSLNDLEFNSKGDVVVNNQTRNLIDEFKTASQSGMGHVVDPQGNSVWARMSQDYQQASDARDAISKIIPIRKFQNEILDPTEVNNATNKMLKMLETPQGTSALMRTNAEIKATTGYDILNDPMGAIQKLLDSNEATAKATQGNWAHQYMEGLKNPKNMSRATTYAIRGALGIAVIGTAFRKQIGSLYNSITGQ